MTKQDLCVCDCVYAPVRACVSECDCVLHKCTCVRKSFNSMSHFLFVCIMHNVYALALVSVQ